MMHRTTGALLISGAAICWPAAVLAQAAPAPAPAPAKPAVPTLSDVLGASGITATGYLDVSYDYLSSAGVFQASSFDAAGNSILRPASTLGVPAVNSRVFDYEHSSFNLHQAAITLAKQPTEGFGALVNLTAGKDASTIRSFEENMSYFDVTQGYVQYAHGPLTLIGGKFVTLAGAETINPTTDTNFSRSILFGYAIPFTHTGLRATWALNDQINAIVGVNNGWDQLKDSNPQKTLEFGGSWTPNKMFSLTAQAYTGTEQADFVPSNPTGFSGGFLLPGADTHAQGTRNLVDVVATLNLTDQLTFIVNPDWGNQDKALDLTDPTGTTRKKANWWGIAGYVNYMLSDQWRVSLRGEYFDDEDGYRTGIIQKWSEVTLTFAYMPTKSIELRAEARYDSSNKDAFQKTSFAATDTGSGSGDKSQSSIGLEALYKF